MGRGSGWRRISNHTPTTTTPLPRAHPVARPVARPLAHVGPFRAWPIAPPRSGRLSFIPKGVFDLIFHRYTHVRIRVPRVDHSDDVLMTVIRGVTVDTRSWCTFHGTFSTLDKWASVIFDWGCSCRRRRRRRRRQKPPSSRPPVTCLRHPSSILHPPSSCLRLRPSY